jgi:hypothetical protein
MEPASFAALPPGQRMLLITRMDDLVNVNEPKMRHAIATLLTELVRLAHESSLEQYSRVVANTFEYGYEKRYGERWHGNGPARAGLSKVALGCDRDAHKVIAREVLSRLDSAQLEDKPGWYFHELRILLQNLLTNATCDDDVADPLGKALTAINEISHQQAD